MAGGSAATAQVRDAAQLSGPLAEPEQQELAGLVRSALLDRLQNGRVARRAVRAVSPRLRQMGASFVAVKATSTSAETRGPVGSVRAVRPLAVDVVSNACHAAFDDPRWPPVSSDIVDRACVDLDIVGPLDVIDASDYEALVARVHRGRDGLVLAHEGNTFTFLPEVWHSSRDAADFVALLWRKAGLTPGELPKRARLAIFETQTYQLPLVS